MLEDLGGCYARDDNERPLCEAAEGQGDDPYGSKLERGLQCRAPGAAIDRSKTMLKRRCGACRVDDRVEAKNEMMRDRTRAMRIPYDARESEGMRWWWS